MIGKNRIDVQEFWDEHEAWSQSAFGSDAQRGPAGPLKHLIKEANEALANPGDASEFADCLMLVFDAARRSGLTFQSLMDAAWAKLKVNQARVWPKTSSDEPVEHVKGE